MVHGDGGVDGTSPRGAGTGIDAAVRDRLERARSTHRVPSLAAAVVRDGDVAWTGGVGQVDGRGGARPTGHTQYRIGSITKTMTAALVLESRDAGRLALHDPVDVHLDVGPMLGRVRLADLLGHVGGVRAELSAPWWERSAGRTWDEVLADLGGDQGTPAPPGIMHYSNPGYAVLGRVLEVVEGRPWSDLLAARLLGPLGLERTSKHAVDDDHATPLAVHPTRDELLVEPAHDYGAMAPAGQLWSSARDLGRWAEVLLGHGGGVLPADTIAAMGRPRAVTTMDPPSAFGCGLQALHLRGRDLVGHGGSVPGFVATVFVDRDAGAGVAVLGNSTAGFGPELALDLLDLVDPDGREVDAARSHEPAASGTDDRSAGTGGDDRVGDDTAGSSTHDLEELVGTWYWGPRPVVVAVDPGGGPVVDVGVPTRRSRFDRRDGQWVGRDGYFTGEVLAVVRRPDGTVGHLDLASMALTPGPYDPPESVPGGVGDGWVPGRPEDRRTGRA